MYEKWAEPGTANTNGYHTGTGAMPAPDLSPSVIRDTVGFAEETLSELHEAINHLEKRLEPALRPMPPVTDNIKPSPTGPPMSHVAGRLAILNEGFRQAVSRLRELTQRVEV